MDHVPVHQTHRLNFKHVKVLRKNFFFTKVPFQVLREPLRTGFEAETTDNIRFAVASQSDGFGGERVRVMLQANIFI